MSRGILNPAELQCCGRQMLPMQPSNERITVYICKGCGWGVTEVEFLRSAHLQNVRQAVERKEIGRQF